MAVYNNTRKAAALSRVEFTPVSDGNFSFFYVDSPLEKEGVKKLITSSEFGQEIVAETQVDGHSVLVTHGDKTKEQILSLLEGKGQHFTFSHKAKPFNAWAARGMLGLGGQGLQLTSSLMRGKTDVGLFVFAISNIAANIMGMVMGPQESDDKYRLQFLKKKFNDKLSSHLPPGEKLPAVTDDRSALHEEPALDKSFGDKTKEFLRRNSVYVGELGLRYFAAFALAFPMNKWGKGFAKLKTGAFKEAYQLTRNDSMHSHVAGVGSLVGKNLAFFSKAEDPYNPNPKGWLDTIREKWTFKTGGAIEAASFATLSYGAFKTGKIKIRGKEHTDFLSGTGAAMFTTAYITRHFAKFGVKETDMDELYAHVADSLAKVPPEKLPQVMADAAADIKEHFKDQPMDFGKVFTQLMTDLYRYHHIALENLGTEPDERAPQPKPTAKHTLKHAAHRPPASHVEKTAKPACDPSQSASL